MGSRADSRVATAHPQGLRPGKVVARECSCVLSGLGGLPGYRWCSVANN